ncbi:hypothetical protein [Ottowia sp. SB7-C50]|uniref:hypothetical protein n=1 Tax=Ottowia sp. SB7-C50 TaxID=3081231 RepID=UPI002955D43F|nr:hypothetical protein [Ottowia sp. SB7-C50]WOP14293.1 hypothetical protein R0D99_10405 [Ottowia sp. SB7-C50]
MVVKCSSSLARRLAAGAGVALAALLGGCVVAPVGPYEVGAPVVYSNPGYAPYYGNAYYGAPAAYYSAPYYRAYWGPTVSLGIWGGWGGGRSYGHRGHHGHGAHGRGGRGGFGRR